MKMLSVAGLMLYIIALYASVSIDDLPRCQCDDPGFWGLDNLLQWIKTSHSFVAAVLLAIPIIYARHAKHNNGPFRTTISSIVVFTHVFGVTEILNSWIYAETSFYLRLTFTVYKCFSAVLLCFIALKVGPLIRYLISLKLNECFLKQRVSLLESQTKELKEKAEENLRDINAIVGNAHAMMLNKAKEALAVKTRIARQRMAVERARRELEEGEPIEYIEYLLAMFQEPAKRQIVVEFMTENFLTTQLSRENSYFRSINVLVADPDGVSRERLSNFIESVGCNLAIVSSSYDCLGVLGEEENQIQLLFLELEMPDIAGISTAQIIRQCHQGNQLAIVALSQHIDDDIRRSCVQVGINHLVRKPVHFQRIAEILCEVLIGSRKK